MNICSLGLFMSGVIFFLGYGCYYESHEKVKSEFRHLDFESAQSKPSGGVLKYASEDHTILMKYYRYFN